jgi:hypothetical protein
MNLVGLINTFRLMAIGTFAWNGLDRAIVRITSLADTEIEC